MKTNKAAEFLANMNLPTEQEEVDALPKPVLAAPPEKPKPVVAEPPITKAQSVSRKGLKHIGGYCDDDTAEKFAIMRVRLKRDNSELLTEAINELYSKYKTKKAFSD
jgi:hypothetical protein